MAIFRYQHGDKPLEGFTIQHGLGRGGFGEVYYAISDSGREVALKAVQNYEDIELRGIKHCMNLKNAQLVSIFDIKHNGDGLPFVVMEFVDGPSLRDIMDSHPEGLGPAKAAFFFQEIANGLGYLHECGVVHRDLKPHNVFYEQGVVKIGDYSLSKAISTSHRGGHTMTVGTVHYMAPEISMGRYDHTVDIYALGVMLYEMLTGHPPFLGESMGEVLMKHVNGKVDVSHLDAPFARVIEKALSKDPRDRYQTMQEMNDDLMGHHDLRDSVASLGPESLTMVAERATKSNEPIPQVDRSTDQPEVTVAAEPPVQPNYNPKPASPKHRHNWFQKQKGPLLGLLTVIACVGIVMFLIALSNEVHNPLPLIFGGVGMVLAAKWYRRNYGKKKGPSHPSAAAPQPHVMYAKATEPPAYEGRRSTPPPVPPAAKQVKGQEVDFGPYPNASPYSRLVSLLMNVPFFLGLPIAGLHRLYAGKIKSGLLWLFTFGLFGIGQLFDLVMIALGHFKDVDGRRVLYFTQDRFNSIRQPVNQYSAVVKRQWTESRVGFRLGNLVLNLLGGILLIVALISGAVMAIDIPRAFADGVFGPKIQEELVRFYTIRDWNEVAAIILAVITMTTGSLAAVSLIFARRESTWSHLFRVPVAATGFICSVISIGSITSFGSRWPRIAAQLNDRYVGGILREMPELVPALMMASLCFVAGMFVLAWPAKRTEVAEHQQVAPATEQQKRQGMTV